jgi:very-short-patch-repair endonuclease
VALLAEVQHGVVARRQLMVLGFTRNTVQDRLDHGRLHRVHRGVYAGGHRKLAIRGYWIAAVLACGPDTVLSHRNALALWDVRPRASGPIDVTIPGRTGKSGPNSVRVHSARDLRDADRAMVDGIPVTSLARSLLDYAAVESPQWLRVALEATARRELLMAGELEELLARSRRHRGFTRLTDVLAQMRGPAQWTQSELENRFLVLIREAGVPEPEVNVFVEGELVDAVWRAARLVVEIDGYDTHKTRSQFEADRRRDAKLQVLGYRVLRLTQSRIDHDPRAVLSEIRALLGS